jgi:hypothetical protein
VAPPTTSVDGQPVAPPQQTPEQRASQQIDNQNKTLQMAKEQLTPTQQSQVRNKITQDVVKKAPEGLGFLLTFQTAVYGSPIDGSARIEIHPFGQRTGADYYDQGTTVGPPSAGQKTTIPETFDVKITNGTVMIQTDHVSAPGSVIITAYYSAAPDIFVQVIGGSTAYDASTSIFTLKGMRGYEQPNSGNVVVLSVQPKTIPKKVVAKNANGVVTELGTEAGGEFIVAAKATGKYGTTSSGERGEEFDVALMTGALDIEQKNGMK